MKRETLTSKMAGSLVTVHTHTHTHIVFTQLGAMIREIFTRYKKIEYIVKNRVDYKKHAITCLL